MKNTDVERAHRDTRDAAAARADHRVGRLLSAALLALDGAGSRILVVGALTACAVINASGGLHVPGGPRDTAAPRAGTRDAATSNMPRRVVPLLAVSLLTLIGTGCTVPHALTADTLVRATQARSGRVGATRSDAAELDANDDLLLRRHGANIERCNGADARDGCAPFTGDSAWLLHEVTATRSGAAGALELRDGRGVTWRFANPDDARFYVSRTDGGLTGLAVTGIVLGVAAVVGMLVLSILAGSAPACGSGTIGLCHR